MRELQEIGYEMQKRLDEGEAIHDDMYVHMLTTKIRSLFPELMAAPTADAEPAVDVTNAIENASGDETMVAEDQVSDELEPSGWIVVGFPGDKERLALFERLLSGWVEPGIG